MIIRSKMLRIIALAVCLAVVASAHKSKGDHGHKRKHVGHHKNHHHHHHRHNHHSNHHYHYRPKYRYEYGVKDDETGDHKSHWELRDGNAVHGEYHMDEADGTFRQVWYKSDKNKGFMVHVKRSGSAQHPHGLSYVNVERDYELQSVKIPDLRNE
ncbi:zinc transporter SLC39A7-like [Toxorhynchites rutilus septentrionalis]|uniref:zinc transporter SLC39A7-like n=1 Tax=Toxorhynchites rutilus septentrionalis TaxID=329112 RepID=UPI00247A074C|nr:zinc transporter SLC39A7-like [Toxorhynchites rutilus septentrionalis]